MKIQIVPVTPFAQNATLIWSEQSMRGAWVDPGGDADTLIKETTQAGVTPEAVLLTHGHVDHIGAARAIADHFNVPIIGPEISDKFWLDALPEVTRQYGFPVVPALTPDRWLTHGETLTVAQMQFEVLHCPGHSPGHVVFYHAPSNCVIAGDVLFAGSIGRTDLPGGDHQQLLDSIRSILFTLPADTQVLCGHGPQTTISAERKSNPFVADHLSA